jgi:hypothetical protein
VLALTSALAVGTTASAHRRDEHLMAARLAVEPGHVDLELDLTPGIAVAEATIADIDRDRDGVLSPAERRAYAARVLDAVVVELDGRPLHLQTVESTFPGLDEVRRGEGTIQLQSSARVPVPSTGRHRLAFRNMYAQDASIYLANALVPVSDRIVITAQRRDTTQRDLTIEYDLRPGLVTSSPAWLLGGGAALSILAALISVPRRPASTAAR